LHLRLLVTTSASYVRLLKTTPSFLSSNMGVKVEHFGWTGCLFLRLLDGVPYTSLFNVKLRVFQRRKDKKGSVIKIYGEMQLFARQNNTDKYGPANPSIHHYWLYPSGFFDCQFHKSRHMVSRDCSALKPNSFSARAGSAVRSGTSPRLRGVSAT
jgi:hypothetical protein